MLPDGMAMAHRHLARRWEWSSMRVTGHSPTATAQLRRADGDGRMRATPLRSQPHCTVEPSVGPAIDATASLQYFLVQRGKGQSGWNIVGRRRPSMISTGGLAESGDVA
jgi:hypothetical protein